MPNSALTTLRLVEAIHSRPLGVVLAATGGGSGAISTLLATPGASRTLLEAVVPYAASSLIRWLGARPEHFCSPRTARAMAMTAFQRALLLAAEEAPPREAGQLAGIGCTASLASDRPKRGPHRAHVAVQTVAATATFSLTLQKEARTRAEEEQVVASLILNALAESAGMQERAELQLLPDEEIDVELTAAPDHWQELFLGRALLVPAHLAGLSSAAHGKRTIFPGAFNPMHEGHRRMAQIAAEILGLPVEFEISVVNVDKPALDYTEMALRSEQFAEHERLWFTRAATFVEKSRLFPGAVFVVGADTMIRLAEPRYYGDDPEACHSAIAEIAGHGCRFLVFGRQTAAGFQTLADLPLPAALSALCDGVPADRFRQDISSTALRQAAEPM